MSHAPPRGWHDVCWSPHAEAPPAELGPVRGNDATLLLLRPLILVVRVLGSKFWHKTAWIVRFLTFPPWHQLHSDRKIATMSHSDCHDDFMPMAMLRHRAVGASLGFHLTLDSMPTGYQHLRLTVKYTSVSPPLR